jgi:hypothetical protein
MKPKFRVTFDSKTSVDVESWNASGALRIALTKVALKQNLEVGDTTTITVSRLE